MGWGHFMSDKPDLIAAAAVDLDRLAGEGFVKPIVRTVLPLEQGGQAVAELEQRRALGKIVLKLR